jgi:hypothetical protein
VTIDAPFDQSESWFCLTAKYDRTVELRARRARGGSLMSQLSGLKGKLDKSDDQIISENVQVDEYRVTDQEIPELRKLVRDFEGMKLSPVMPDTLMMDPYSYHFWTESQWGQQLSASLVGPGPSSPRQPHPLLSWAERLRGISDRHINKTAGVFRRSAKE